MNSCHNCGAELMEQVIDASAARAKLAVQVCPECSAEQPFREPTSRIDGVSKPVVRRTIR